MEGISVRLFSSIEGADKLEPEKQLESHIKSLNEHRNENEDQEDSYLAFNLGQVRSRAYLWKDHLADINTCVDCSMIRGLTPAIKLMAGSGSYFYAMSMMELKSLMEAKVNPAKIIFGQTVKQVSHLEYAKTQNIGYLCFDSAFELHKIRAHYRDCGLLIRVTTHATPDGRVAKYGRNQQSCQDILNTARMLGLKVVGVTAVVKSTTDQNKCLKEACDTVRKLVDYAKLSLGYDMSVMFIKINIDNSDDDFSSSAHTVNRVLMTSFKKMPGFGGTKTSTVPISIIVDPGEFFLRDAASLVATIIGVRRIGTKENKKVSYYINDSIHKSFSHVRIKPSQKFTPTVLFYNSKIKSSKGGVTATVYGYMDDEEDIISQGCALPGDMSNGDRLCFHGLGPYVKTFDNAWLLSNPNVYYFAIMDDVNKIKEWLPGSKISGDVMII